MHTIPGELTGWSGGGWNSVQVSFSAGFEWCNPASTPCICTAECIYGLGALTGMGVPGCYAVQVTLTSSDPRYMTPVGVPQWRLL